jgi:hypothetical protein
VPCCQDGFGLLGCGVCGGTLGNAGGDQDAAELGEHVLEGGLALGGVPGLGVAAGGDADAVVAVSGVPHDDQCVDEQGERDGALDGAAGAVAGLAGAQNVAGVGEGLLDGPAAGVPLDQRGGAGASGGSPRRSGQPSSRWPARCRPGAWTATRPGNCPRTMSAARRSGPWTPLPRPPGTLASR